MITISFESAGKLLRHYRKERSLNQKELAEKAEVSTLIISGIETGKKAASFDVLCKLFGALDLGHPYITIVDPKMDNHRSSPWG
jgi:transcriptional regulator with XRE-family HTH domain